MIGFLILFLSISVKGQMNFQGESLFGNEWIDFSKSYKKFIINQDDIYRISYEDLVAQGLPSDIKGREVQVYSFGKLVPLYITKAGDFGPGDYVEFFGQSNKGELEQPLYDDWENQQMNPLYSMFSDGRAYFLTWEENATTNPRIEELENDLGGDLPAKESFYMADDLQIFNSNNIYPVINAENVRFSHFYITEGFGTPMEKENDIDFDISNISNAGNFANLSLRVGQNSGTHILRMEFNDDLIENETHNGYQVKDYEYEILIEDLKENNVLDVYGNASNFDRNSIAYANLSYPREFNANGSSNFSFNIDKYSFDKYIELENFGAQSGEVFVIDVNNNQRLSANSTSGTIKFILEVPEEERQLFIYAQPQSINNFQDIEFVNYEESSPEFIILTSKELNSDDENGENWIQKYKEFKESSEGGEKNVMIAEYSDIRDQFGYGIQGNPISINNWALYMKDKWPDWQFSFIIGKAHEYGVLRKETQLENFVPTFGQPGSDNLLFAEEYRPYPIMAVGRIAVKDKNEIRTYLDKIMTFEDARQNTAQTIEDKLWMKKVIHLSGGDANNQNIISNYLDQMGDVLKENMFGATINKYQKTTSDPIQNSISEAIINDIDAGCALITFFGHSAVGTFDFSIEDPSKLSNAERLPVIFSLGCHSGNIHTKAEGISEDFVLYPNNGSIGFYASSSTAYINEQFVQGRDMYEFIGDKLYGQPIGLAIQEALKLNYVDTIGAPIPGNDYFSNIYFRLVTLEEQLTYHGDPSLILYSHEGPDYTPSITSFRTEPEVISTNVDNFDLKFDVINLGKHLPDSLDLKILHSYGTQTDSIDITIATPANSSTISQTLALNGLAAAGKNTIEVIIDQQNKIDEFPNPSAESNNSINGSFQLEGYCFYVVSDNPLPYHPTEFAITNDQDLILRSSTGNAFVETNSYNIQIDTTELFNSNLLVQETLTVNGGLIDWNPEMTFLNNTVYYWRIQAANSQAGDVWNYSSFIFMEEFDNGWNQSHLYQYFKDDFSTMEVDSSTRDFEYVSDFNELKIICPVRITSTDHLEVRYNESRIGAVFNVDSLGMAFVVMDPNTIVPIPCPGNGTLGADNRANAGSQDIWIFRTDTEQERQECINFMNNEIPEGYFVIAATTDKPGEFTSAEEWDNDFFSAFESQGAQMIRDIGSVNRPYIFAYKKDGGVLEEELGDVDDPQEINKIITIEGSWFEGTMFSTKIGPAQKWEKLLWEVENFEETEDEFRISLFGVTPTGQEDTLVYNVQNTEYDLSAVNAATYPCLRLEYYSTDVITNSAPDLDYWRVVYKPLPDVVISAEENFVFQSDTIPRGETLLLGYDIENISESNMDSMLVKYTFIDRQNNETSATERYEQVTAGNKIRVDYEKETSSLSGLYELRVEVNPDQDQPEQYRFNNLGFLRFLVAGDDLNPTLDVTFDGVRIIDGDIVSPSPVIKIVLSDDNTFLVNDDPENFEITLEYKDADGNTEFVEISSDDINFIPPAEEGDPTCIEYTPSLGEGEYTLYVQGKDASGNFSGDQPYTVSFQVILEQMLSNVLTYPNPFSTQTQFIFTMTGAELPDSYHIKIMSLSGKVVKEITQEELGPIHLGINRTEYKWDGTDDFGSKLANGVYIYKFYTDMDTDFGQLELGNTSDHFKKGFGKLVILR